MLLQKLTEYADRESDIEDLPLLYELIPVKWLIQLDSKENTKG